MKYEEALNIKYSIQNVLGVVDQLRHIYEQNGEYFKNIN